MLEVRVTPRASGESIEADEGGHVHARVKAAPTDGSANGAVLRLLSKALGIPPSRLSIRAGAASRTKLIAMDGLAPAEAMARLAARAKSATEERDRPPRHRRDQP
ncbi:MAG: DUF167 domain-containing protein [Armatimonadetes bacterium]|nr:DUF167 domain-containing protein [Armatimonadota bacterium]